MFIYKLCINLNRTCESDPRIGPEKKNALDHDFDLEFNHKPVPNLNLNLDIKIKIKSKFKVIGIWPWL